MNKKNFAIITGFILLAVLSRVLPHPYNFTPLGAIALFGSAYFTDKKWAFIIPVAAMWISDLILNNLFYSSIYGGFTLINTGMIWIYGSIILIALVGMKTLKKVTVPRVLGSALSASVIFFIISNLGVWLTSGMYPLNESGLIATFTAAIPFFHNTIAGDLVYCSVLFGAYEFAKYKYPGLVFAAGRS